MTAGRSRGFAPALCGTIGILLILAAVLLGYMTRSLFSEDAFSARVAASLRDPEFAGYVAEKISDAVIKAKPDLIGLRPVLVGVARGVVTSAPFRAAVRRSARLMHHAVMSGTGTSFALDVKDLGVLFESMSETHPGLSHKIPPRISAVLGELESLPGGERMVRIVRFAKRMRVATLALFVLGLALCTISVRLARDRRMAIVRIGVALALLGLVFGIVARFGGLALALVVRKEENYPAAAGLAGAFLGGLLQWAIALGCAGLVLAAASASLLERVPLQRWAGHVRHWLAGPTERMGMRLVRGLIAAAAGFALLVWPLPTVTVAMWLIGLVVVFAGLREAFAAALHMLPAIERAALRETAGRAPRRGAITLVAGLALALVAGGTWLILRSGAEPPEPEGITACNGTPLLCDRTLDQVVFPTSHNSMSGANIPGWMFPNQNADIERQLADGVRGFLIDVHYAVPVGDRVKTDLGDETKSMATYEAAVGKEGVDAALRIRGRLTGQETGPRDVYMCHGFCELGAIKLVPVLRDVRDFLVANPGEVLIFVIQDEGVSPQDIERCFKESGLIDFVYRGSVRPPWPTLRQMVESDQRVLVMAENNSAGVDWYHPAFEVLQETPYAFHDPSEFSNRPNRGGTGGSLKLLNHWIETTPLPKPSNAEIVNAHDALLKRIRDFRRERGGLPNLVAVDFYATGDMIQVVRELNEQPLAAGKSGKRGKKPA